MGKEQEVIKAAKTGDIRTLERYLVHSTKRTSMIGNIKKSIHPNIQDELGYTLLHHATLNGHRETVAFLLRNGASTTISDTSGSYPLHLASWKGDVEIVRLLTTLGPSRANVDQQSHTEDTALHFASQYGYCGVVEFLLERHANPMMKNIRGETPLDLAAQFGHIDTVHVLISHCPEILRLSRPEMSPLHLAARNGHSVVVLSLINAGIPINSVCKSGSALHEAALCGKENTVKLLLDKGIDVNLKNSENRTVQEVIAEFSNEKYIKIKNLIRRYKEGDALPTGRYMKPKRQKLLAIPKRNSKTSPTPHNAMSDLPLLQYMQDEAITVCGRLTAKVYIGKLHSVTGTFPLKDTRLFQDIDGQLHRVYPKNIIESPEDGTLHVLQQSLLDGNQKDWERKSMLEPHPEPMMDKGPIRSLSTSDTTTSEDALERKKKSRLTDKEKRFILSKDTGAYSQLTPVNAPDDVGVREVPKSVKENKEGEGYIGSYYLLEVGNFDTKDTSPLPPPPESPPRLPPKRSQIAQYENVQLRTPPVIPLEKPRSTSDGSLLNTTTTIGNDVPQKRSKSFQNYENSPLIHSVEPTTSKYHHRVFKSHTCTFTEPQRNLDTIDRRGPMPLPYEGTEIPLSNDSYDVESQDDDVMVSSINPNYSKVVHGYVSSSQMKPFQNDATAAGVWIIPQNEHPFAGLVESSSYHDSLSEEYTCRDGYIECPPLPRSRLKSVWDDKRVNQEWNQIDDVLKDMNTDIIGYETVTHDSKLSHHNSEVMSPNEVEKSNVFLWLSGIGLQGYTGTFESNGFDDVKFMGGGIVDIDDLKQMGIYDNDRSTIMVKIAVLPPPPRFTDVTNVEHFLKLLNLLHLKDCFSSFTLERLSTLWEIQLSTLIGIDLLGYHKRLLYGINELRRIHPEWAPSPSLPRNNFLSSLGPIADVDFTKDYSQIRSVKNDQLEIFSSLDELSPIKWTQSKLTTKSHTSKVENSNKTTLCEIPVRGAEYAANDSPPLTITEPVDSPLPSKVSTIQESLPSSESKKYHAGYLGSALVKGIPGKHSAEEACLKLRTQTDGIAKIPQIILSISWKGVKFVNADSKIVVSTHLIRDISHCCPDIEDPRVFAYMTKDKETNSSYCHVFMVPSKDIADEIIATVGQAFEVAYQAVVRARSRYKSPTGSPKKSLKSSVIKKSFRKLQPQKQLSQDIVDDNGIK